MSTVIDEALWEKDPQWQLWRDAVRGLPGKLTLLELCGGTGAAFLALSKLLPAGALELAGHWDIDTGLAEVLRAVHSDCSRIHLGPGAGDILATDVEHFPPSHAIVAGPPCPPWSKLGRRESFSDKRCAVFWRVIDIVTCQANIGTLGMFVLENVEALAHRDKAKGNKAPLDTVLEELRSNLPSGWKVAAQTCNSLKFGVPQRRARIYIVGHCVKLFGYDACPQPLGLSQSSLSTLLAYHPVAVKQNIANTDLQQQNLDDWKQLYRDMMLDRVGGAGSLAVVDISRTPSGRTAWGAKALRPDIVECLTAAGPNLHVFALGEGMNELSIDRRLTGPERAALQGFPPSICKLCQNTAKDKRIFGNAMTVPVVGAVMATELARLLDIADKDTVSQWLGGKAPTDICIHAPTCVLNGKWCE